MRHTKFSEHVRVTENLNTQDEVDNLHWVSADYDGFYEFVIKLLDKYNFRYLNGVDLDTKEDDKVVIFSMPKEFSDRRGEVQITSNSFRYFLPAKSDIYARITKQKFDKYNMSIDDGAIEMGLYVGNGLMYLKTPIHIKDKRTGKDKKDFFSINKYDYASIGRGAYKSKPQKAKEILEKIRLHVENMDYVPFDYSTANIMDMK